MRSHFIGRESYFSEAYMELARQLLVNVRSSVPAIIMIMHAVGRIPELALEFNTAHFPDFMVQRTKTPLDFNNQLKFSQGFRWTPKIESREIGRARLLKYFSVGRRFSSLWLLEIISFAFGEMGPPRTKVKLADSNPQTASRLEVGIHIVVTNRTFKWSRMAWPHC